MKITLKGNGTLTREDVKKHITSDKITTVIIEDYVSIVEGAFQGTSIKEISIPSSVRQIEMQAFYNISSLSKVNFIGNSELLTIGAQAFQGTALTEFSIPQSVRHIEEQAFYKLKSLSKVVFGSESELLTIGAQAFQGTSITDISIPPSVKNIEEQAFYKLKSLSKVNFIGESMIQTIGAQAFEGTGVKKVSFSQHIQKKIFDMFKEPILFDLNIPSSVEQISNNEYFNMKQIWKVNFMSNSKLKIIGDHAFEGTNITEINIPDGVDEIGIHAFKGTSITEISIPSSVRSIGAAAFQDTNIQSVIIPESITIIEKDTFKGARKLTVVKFGSKLQTIKLDAFNGCESLVEIIFPPSLTLIESGAFIGCTKLDNITISNFFLQETQNGELSKAFNRGSNFNYYIIFEAETGSNILTLSNVSNTIKKLNLNNSPFTAYIGDNVSIIGTNAFSEVETLQEIYLSINLTKIDSDAFRGCTNLEIVNVSFNNNIFPESKLTSIGDHAFTGCNIRNFVIPNNVETIGAGCFFKMNSLEELIFYPETKITSLGDFFCAECSKLEILRIPTSIIHIGNSAFANCPQIEKLILPHTLKTIGDSAFENCTSLFKLNIPYTIETIGTNAFRSCISLLNVILPHKLQANIENTFNEKIPTEYSEKMVNQIKAYNSQYEYYIWSKKVASGWANDGILSDAYYKNFIHDNTPRNTKELIIVEGNRFYHTYFSEHFLREFSDYRPARPSELPGISPNFPATGRNVKTWAKSYINSGDATRNINTASTNITNSTRLLENVEWEYEPLKEEIFVYEFVFEKGDTQDNVLDQATVSKTINSYDKQFNVIIQGNTITSIGENAFKNSKCTSINFNNAITDIGTNAFMGSDLNGQIVLPISLLSISQGAFMNCTQIYSVILPIGLKTIAEKAFENCSGIGYLYIPRSVETIGSDALASMKLDTLTMGYPNKYDDNLGLIIGGRGEWGGGWGRIQETSSPSKASIKNHQYEIIFNATDNKVLTHEMVRGIIGEFTKDFIAIIDNADIGENAFENTNVSIVRIGNAVSVIGKDAFINCKKLKQINFSARKISINTGAFTNCPLLKTVSIASINYKQCNKTNFSRSDNKSVNFIFHCVLSGNGNQILTQEEVSTQMTFDSSFTALVSITFDTDITIIAADAFNGNKYIGELLIPQNITTIGDYAFANTDIYNFESVPGSSLITIGEYAFHNCINLSHVRIPYSVSMIGTGAFISCPNLYSVILPDIFDFKNFTQTTHYFESSLMKNVSWNHKTGPAGTFFTFHFQHDSGTMTNVSYTETQYNYVQVQKYNKAQAAKEAAKEAAEHKESIWSKIGWFAVGFVAILAVSVLTGGIATGIMAGGEAALDAGTVAASSALSDTAVDGAADAADEAADAAADGSAEGSEPDVKPKSWYIEYYDNLTMKQLVSITVGNVLYTVLGDYIIPFNSSFGSTSAQFQYTPEEANEYTPDIAKTTHSSGSWIIKTEITTTNKFINLNEIRTNIVDNRILTLMGGITPTSITVIHLKHNKYTIEIVVETAYESVSDELMKQVSAQIETNIKLYGYMIESEPVLELKPESTPIIVDKASKSICIPKSSNASVSFLRYIIDKIE